MSGKKVWVFYLYCTALFAAVYLPGTASESAAPQIFAPGVISTGHEFGITFTPNGKELYFSRFESKKPIHIFHAVMADGKWQQPEPISFSSDHWSDLDPFLSPDGTHLFFVSTRPAPWAAAGSKNMDIWVATMESGKWGEPRWLEGVNSAGKEGSPSVDRAGNLYGITEVGGDTDRCSRLGCGVAYEIKP